MRTDQSLYRIQFVNNSKNYQLYVRELSNSNLFGFIEIGDFIFTTSSAVLVDPGAEKIKTEFTDVTKSYIPVQAIIRIDLIREKHTQYQPLPLGNNITPFPFPPRKRT
ncbi:MAG: DUF1820 family protein [Candidatus Dasytiphilus stammeri]